MGYGVNAVFGDGANAIGVNATDPNTAELPFNQVVAARARSSSGVLLYALPKGGTTITIQVWVFERTLARWFKLGSPVACPVDTLTNLVPAPGLAVPGGARVGLQVTANTGVLQVGVGFYEDSGGGDAGGPPGAP